MAAALTLLGRYPHDPPATLVACVPTTYHHEDMEVMQTLPRDTFATANVATKIIRFQY